MLTLSKDRKNLFSYIICATSCVLIFLFANPGFLSSLKSSQSPIASSSLLDINCGPWFDTPQGTKTHFMARISKELVKKPTSLEPQRIFLTPNQLAGLNKKIQILQTTLTPDRQTMTKNIIPALLGSLDSPPPMLCLTVKTAPDPSERNLPDVEISAIRITGGTFANIPYLPTILAPLFFSLFAGFMLLGLKLEKPATEHALVVVAFVLLEAFKLLFDHGWVISFASFAGLGGFLMYKKLIPAHRLRVLAVWAVCALAFTLSWNRLVAVSPTPLEPDANMFFQLAQNLSNPFDTSFREPFFVWAIKAATWVLGPGYMVPRYLGVLFFAAGTAMTYFYARRKISPAAGITAALFFATNPFIIRQSVRGLRFTLFICMLLLFLRFTERKNSALCAGLTAGFLALLRISSVFITVPLMLFYAWKNKQGLRPVVLGVLLCGFMLLPCLIANSRLHNDPLHSLNTHSRYYMGKIFDKTNPQAYADKGSAYLLEHFGAGNLCAQGIKGFVNIFAGNMAKDIFFNANTVFLVLFLTGLLVLPFYFRFLWDIVVTMLVFIGPVAAIAQLSYPEFDSRLVYHTAPLMAALAALPFQLFFGGRLKPLIEETPKPVPAKAKPTPAPKQQHKTADQVQKPKPLCRHALRQAKKHRKKSTPKKHPPKQG